MPAKKVKCATRGHSLTQRLFCRLAPHGGKNTDQDHSLKCLGQHISKKADVHDVIAHPTNYCNKQRYLHCPSIPIALCHPATPESS